MIHDPMHHSAHLLGCAENKQFFAQMYKLHYGKKIREVRIIHRTLRESGFLLVKYYTPIVDHGESFGFKTFASCE